MVGKKKALKRQNKVILVNADQPEEIRVALVEDGRLEAFDVETVVRKHTRGNIYKGLLVNIEPSLQAAFIDIGLGRNGYLPFKEIHPEYYGYAEAIDQSGRSRLPEFLETGQELLVQIVKEETPTKGPSLTTFLTIPGRYVVLMPGSPFRKISKKVTEEAKRKRLKDILLGIKIPEEIGVIMRTAAAEAAKKNILADLRYLLRLWNEIKKQAASVKAPKLLYKDQDVITRFLREYLSSEVKEILVDTDKAFNVVKKFLKLVSPRQTGLVKRFTQDRPIFSLFGLEDQIENIYQPVVHLPSGGTIFIEPTEALVAIDVNSGRFVKEKDPEEIYFRTNLEAAEEIARQLRLRDLGGLIVIDFIAMRQAKHRNQVEKHLRECLKKDRAKLTMTRFSKLGLIELARQKLQAPIQWGSYRPCPCCRGQGLIRTVEVLATGVLRRLRSRLAEKELLSIRLITSPELASYLLNRKRRELFALEEHYNTIIIVEADLSFSPEETKFEEEPKLRPVSESIRKEGEKVEPKEEIREEKSYRRTSKRDSKEKIGTGRKEWIKKQ